MVQATKTLSHQPTTKQSTRAQREAVGMQRRHFELIAEIIAKELDGEYREKAAYAFAYILPMTNANFNSQKFLAACKVSAFADGGNQ